MLRPYVFAADPLAHGRTADHGDSPEVVYELGAGVSQIHIDHRDL